MNKNAFIALTIFSSLYLSGCGKPRFVQNRADAQDAGLSNQVPQDTIVQQPITAGQPLVIPPGSPTQAPSSSANAPTQAPSQEYSVTTTRSGEKSVRIFAAPAQCRLHEDHLNLEATGQPIVPLHNNSLEGDWIDDADITRRGVLVMQFPLASLERRTAIFPTAPAYSSLQDYLRAERSGRVAQAFRPENQTVFMTNGAQCTLTHILGNLPSSQVNWVYARVLSASSDSSPSRVVFETPSNYYTDRPSDRNPQMFRLVCEKMDQAPFTIAEVNRITCSTVRMRVPNDRDFRISQAICPRYGAIGRRSCTTL